MPRALVRRYVTVTVIALAIAVGGRVGIAHADNRELARAEFTAGQDSDTAHDYVTAIQHYLRAVELVPHPFTLFNIAVDYERLGKLRDAVTYYRRYAEGTPDSPDRAKTIALIAELEAKPSHVTVRTIPSGARVTIDGAVVTPAPYQGSLRPGPHAITVELAGHSDHRDITVAYGEPQDVHFDLGGASGSLVVTANPTGALITVDGSAIGLSPSTIELEPGAHHVQLTSFGYAAYDVDVDIQSGHPSEVTTTLVRDNAGQAAAGPTTLPAFGLFAGGGGGVDLGGGGALGYGVVGARFGPSEAVVELGGASAGFTASALYRYNIGGGSTAVFLGFGYVFSPSVSYELEAGLRVAIAHGEHARIDLRASARLRYDSTATSGESVPILVSLEAATR